MESICHGGSARKVVAAETVIFVKEHMMAKVHQLGYCTYH